MRRLFDKTKIKNKEIKNRFVKAAVWEGLATADGHMTEDLYAIYDQLARGGIGTIITGYACVNENEQPNPNMMGIYNDSFIDEYKILTEMVHKTNTRLILQLVYGGSLTHLKPPSQDIWSPSGHLDDMSGVKTKAMSLEDIELLKDQFVKAAIRADKAGFDGVEIHAAHGYLLSQFFSPKFNKRQDQYGGSIKNRARLVGEIIEKIKLEVKEDFLVLVKVNSEDFIEDGLTSSDSIEISKLLEASGLDAIEVSGGNESSLSVLENNLGPARTNIKGSNESYFKDHASRLAEVLSIPVILTGGNRHFEVMQDLLRQSSILYFGLARPMISQPDLVNQWQDNESTSPRCISCNKCYHTHGKRCIF